MLNKIPSTSRPSVDVQIEWYISSLPSNIGIFVDTTNKNTLVDNMKEVVSIEKGINAIGKKKISGRQKIKKSYI